MKTENINSIPLKVFTPLAFILSVVLGGMTLKNSLYPPMMILEKNGEKIEYPLEAKNILRSIASSKIIFTYDYKGKPLKLTLEGLAWEEAFNKATHKCMDYYTDGQGPSVGEDIWLDLIDVCVNPREKR